MKCEVKGCEVNLPREELQAHYNNHLVQDMQKLIDKMESCYVGSIRLLKYKPKNPIGYYSQLMNKIGEYAESYHAAMQVVPDLKRGPNELEEEIFKTQHKDEADIRRMVDDLIFSELVDLNKGSGNFLQNYAARVKDLK